MSCFQWFKRQKAKQKYKNCTLKNVPRFHPPLRFVKVVKVYDGDTITVVGSIDSKKYLFSVRLAGIDAPEIKGKTPQEREQAQAAKHALSQHIFGKVIELKNIKNEKYGRVLSEVWYKGNDVSAWMLEHKYAVKYYGGKKIDWASLNH